jgi:beta-phosphoglucomutase-like phosphatase (HAD superfamily)
MANQEERYAACIFDMDSLLVETTAVWLAAEERLLARMGHVWTQDIAMRWHGMNAPDVARTIHEIYKPNWPVAESQAFMREGLLAAFRSSPALKAMPGAVELVRALRWDRHSCLSGEQRQTGMSALPSAGPPYPLALASGSPREGILIALERLGIRECFSAVLSSEEVPHGKPAPDVFLAAAKALNVEPAHCVVFEDSLVGARAARAAGMACFTVPSAEREQVAAMSTRVLHTLADAIPLLVQP